MVSEDFKIHPQYDNKVIAMYNVCLVKLTNPIEFSNAIAPIRLPSTDQSYDSFISKTGRISGIGDTDSLLWGEVEIIEKMKCKHQEFSSWSVEASFCVVGNADTPYNIYCRGEDGRPLVVQDNDGDWMQIGIAVEFGGAFCGGPMRTVYHNILPHLEFIKKTITGSTVE